MENPNGINANNKTRIIIAVLVVFGLLSMAVAWRYANTEQAREKLNWQNRISAVLNGRADAVEKWLQGNKNAIDDLSENATLRLYLSSLSSDMGLVNAGEAALGEYILPLLNDRANQNGFSAIDSEQFEVNANTPRQKHAGLAITDTTGKILVATAGMPRVEVAVNTYIYESENRNIMMIGPYDGESGLPTISIIKPVFGIDDDGTSSALGFLVGVKLLDKDFFDLLVQPGEALLSAENYLIRKQNGMIYYIQNLTRTDPEFQPLIEASTPMLASNFAFENLGKMAEMMNYNGESVLVSGSEIATSDWVLVRTIAINEALGGANVRKRNFLIISALALFSFGVILALIWRHSVSSRLQQAIEKQRVLSQKHENLSEFMSVVTNSQPTEISAVDENGKYTFVNLQAAIAAESKPQDMIGKTPSSVLGQATSRVDELHCAEVLVENKAIAKIRDIGTEIEMNTFKTDYLPLRIGDQDKGVLMVKEDITSIVQSRLKRELSLKSLVSTLTMIIGSRDPYSAAHSERVVTVTNMLCLELNVDEKTATTAELAGAMMNLGKILVSRELLTKPTNLTGDELSIIRSSMLKSAELIKDIEFEGPVCETLEQMHAHFDGTGQPAGLSGEDILLSARIVSVANAFVGMTSVRAHRSGMDMKKAIQILMGDADSLYDRRPVVALMNYLENKDGLEKWKYFNEPPKTSHLL
ncbi:MAG: HD domain-containing protein [Kordiimonadaceae bacterium]|nr:HD domain-containing protein [Kordiimonadaceae bacterium]